MKHLGRPKIPRRARLITVSKHQVARVAIEHPGQHLIAAFDFDGTAIQGNSPVLLVRYLQKRGMLGKRVIGKILAWAAAYKLRFWR